MTRAEYLRQKYHLEQHTEGGCFAEVYTAPFSHADRSLMGSIYFLLEGEDISHFHQIDCDEIWYHHEGCGLKITMIIDGILSEVVIGSGEDQLAMAVIPKGAIFAAENLDKGSFCFMSCATTPKFTYDGFKLVPDKEIKHICPADYEKIKHLAFSEVMIGCN
ncbi:cupin domain-containing protein [Butyrivibrio sp. NC2002]|uniref:cupin domain-containing protein n=1 Tax=Butyrivibrio sp. NC2002 TaxID=1410610 RepID=UPI00068B071E|nr:cupin domain-containing protein [Butyrivibrio sp. NC2002]